MNIDLAHIAHAADQFDLLLGGDDDERLFHDMLCGETDIDHMVSRLHEQRARDGEMLVGIKARAEALAERKQRIEARCDAAKALIGKILRAGHLLKLELPEVTYSVRDGKPVLKVVDPEAVPADLCRTKVEPDKNQINAQFADTGDLPNWLVREPAKDIVTARTR